ncbi:MAG: phage major tail tube protein [Bacteroidota bacterium]|nr:phage major tail tube protein [Bacteroidota bacterium]
MAAITITRVQDANVYINGTSTHGQAQEVSLPEIPWTKVDYKALGMIGVMKLFHGVDALEATIKWNYPDNDVQVACANPIAAVDLMVRSNKVVYTGSDVTDNQPVVVMLKGTSANHSTGSYKAKEDTDLSTKLDITYLKQTVNGRDILEIDIPNNIIRIDGVDIMLKYKQNLGLA